MNATILAACAIIRKAGKYLITRRPQGSHNGLRWEFPGGAVEFGEDPADCIKREVKEELGITVNVGDLFGYSSFVYSEDKHIILLAFYCDCTAGDIQKREINDYAWVLPSEMAKYDMTEADIPFVTKLQLSCEIF